MLSDLRRMMWLKYFLVCASLVNFVVAYSAKDQSKRCQRIFMFLFITRFYKKKNIYDLYSVGN